MNGTYKYKKKGGALRPNHVESSLYSPPPGIFAVRPPGTLMRIIGGALNVGEEVRIVRNRGASVQCSHADGTIRNYDLKYLREAK